MKKSSKKMKKSVDKRGKICIISIRVSHETKQRGLDENPAG